MGRSARRTRLERQALAREPFRPLRVLLLGRTGRRRSGGIGRSAVLIQEALERLGNRVRLRNVREPLTDIPSDTDLVWHYGDYDLVEQQAEACDEASVPMLINSTHDDTPDRRRWMEDLIERTGAYLVVFSQTARDDARMHRIRDQLVAVPKTIRVAPDPESVDFEVREGIVLGELEKLRRARLVRGMDVERAVAALREALPSATLYAYDQYATAATEPPAGVTVASPGEGMLRWLAGRRLFVSLSRHETFAMVPCEAQGVGTPVLYRPMPQSLTEYLGSSAVTFESVDELALAASVLYEDEARWSALSRAGRANAEARGMPDVHVALDMALRKVVMA